MSRANFFFLKFGTLGEQLMRGSFPRWAGGGGEHKKYFGYSIKKKVFFLCFFIYNNLHNICIRYRENVQGLYEIFMDRPMSPKQLVSYWTEYAINHREVGDRNMRIAAIRVPWYQYYLFDVTLIVLLILLIALTISLYTLVLLKRILQTLKLYKLD